jgi:cephalosporin-C deacetylase-like acetyl esterase
MPSLYKIPPNEKEMAMNRRHSLSALALAVALCGAAVAQPPVKADGDLSGMTDAYLTKIEQQDLSVRHDEIAAIRNASQVRERQAYIEKTLLHELGGFPERTPLHAQINGTLDRPDYQVQKLVYQSLPNFYVTANVYVPKSGHKPYPAILGVAGHSPYGKAADHYQTVWISLARRGFLVIAIDPVGQGERFEHLDPNTHRSLLPLNGTPEHMADGLQAMLTGSSLARYITWDGIRAIDYLESRDDVDKAHIGVTGVSGGGTQSTYIATLDSRISAAAIACYLTSWNAMWADPGPQDSEQVLDRFLADHLDYADFLIRIAPRPVEMDVATRDFFPIAGAHATYAEAKNIFHLLGVDDHINLTEADNPHRWSTPLRLSTYKWFAHWFQNRPDSGVEADVKLEIPAELNATPSGQVLITYPHAETVQSLNAALAEKLRAKPAPTSIKQLAVLVRKRLDLPKEKLNPSVEKTGFYTQGNARVEKINIQTEPGITVPGLVFTPSKGPARKHAILYLNPAGMAADAASGGAIDQLVQQGNVVLAIDPRGWGESAPPHKMVSGYRTDYQMSMHAILVGKSIPGMQTYDVLSAFQYLAKRSDVNPREISLHTQGIASNLGIFAAVLQPRIKTVVCDKAPMSFLAITQLKLNKTSPEAIIPGVLLDFDLPDLTQALGSRFRIGE